MLPQIAKVYIIYCLYLRKTSILFSFSFLGMEKLLIKHDRKSPLQIRQIWLEHNLYIRSLYKQEVCKKIEFELKEQTSILKHEKLKFALSKGAPEQHATVQEYLYKKKEYDELISEMSRHYDQRIKLAQIAFKAVEDDNFVCVDKIFTYFFTVAHLPHVLLPKIQNQPSLFHSCKSENLILKMLSYLHDSSVEVIQNVFESYDLAGNLLIHAFCQKGFPDALSNLLELAQKAQVLFLYRLFILDQMFLSSTKPLLHF